MICGILYVMISFSFITKVPLKMFPDSIGYLYVHDYVWEGVEQSTNIWLKRPFSFPVFLTLFHDLFLIRLLQETLFCASFIFLGYALRNLSSHRVLRKLIFVMPLIFSFSHNLVFWPAHILTESLTISCINVMAGLILIGFTKKKWSLKIFIFFCCVWLFFNNLRDANIYLSALVLPLIFFIQDKQPKLRLLVFFLALAANYFLLNITVERGERFKNPVTNVLCKRIFPHPDRLAFFQEKGLPEGNYIHAYAGKFSYEVRDTMNPSFDRYLKEKAASDFKWYLLTHPSYTFSVMNEGMEEALDADLWKTYSYLKAEQFRGSGLHDILWPSYYIILACWFVVMAIAALKRKYGLLVLISYAFIVLYLNLLLCFHGDAMEEGRHCLVPNYLLRMLCMAWLGALAFVFVKPPVVPAPKKPR